MSHYFFKQLARIYIIYCGCGPTQSGNDPFALFSKMNPAGTTVAVHPEAAVRLHTISGAKLPISYPFPYKCQQQCTSYALTMPTCLRLIEMQLCVFVHLFPFLSITSNNNRCWHGSRLTITSKTEVQNGEIESGRPNGWDFQFSCFACQQSVIAIVIQNHEIWSLTYIEKYDAEHFKPLERAIFVHSISSRSFKLLARAAT